MLETMAPRLPGAMAACLSLPAAGLAATAGFLPAVIAQLHAMAAQSLGSMVTVLFDPMLACSVLFLGAMDASRLETAAAVCRSTGTTFLGAKVTPLLGTMGRSTAVLLGSLATSYLGLLATTPLGKSAASSLGVLVKPLLAATKTLFGAINTLLGAVSKLLEAMDTRSKNGTARSIRGPTKYTICRALPRRIESRFSSMLFLYLIKFRPCTKYHTWRYMFLQLGGYYRVKCFKKKRHNKERGNF